MTMKTSIQSSAGHLVIDSITTLEHSHNIHEHGVNQEMSETCVVKCCWRIDFLNFSRWLGKDICFFSGIIFSGVHAVDNIWQTIRYSFNSNGNIHLMYDNRYMT